MASFAKVPDKFSFPKKEQDVLKFWKEIDAFKNSVSRREQKDSSNSYNFYDGPPFATGLPHYGHFVASTIKDVVARYWTMRGKYVERRFGWDTHGLPIEMEIEKKLQVSGPTEIRELGVDKFNEACRSSVLRYAEEWESIITRLGRWVDFDNDYKTMDPSFMESVWWVFGELWRKGLVYKDFRVMPYSWRLSTPLSNFEANMDYRNVQDPAITVKLPLIDDADNAVLLVWTTTPWTLPANLAVAVGSDIDYVRASAAKDEQVYILAKDRVTSVLGKDAQIFSTFKGKELLGKKYSPLFNYFTETHDNIYQVLAAEHVTTEDGTGLVHMAPAFGQEDFEACKAAGLPFLGFEMVDEEGRFSDIVIEFAKQNIKEADPKIIRLLKDRGLLFKQDTLQHNYPFCWRSGTPLIYKAVPTWFVNVTSIKEKLIENNKEIHWVPEAIGEKRFGNWLADAQDWSISRNRFWGTPIPIWQCEACDKQVCISSIEDLEKRSGEKVTDLHSHFVDKITFPCECKNTMHRITEVFDCWFESGSMPYAQIHYPFENKAEFAKLFPAQFIAEGLDQTRAWFYTLLVLSTAIFDEPPFKNVIVNGLVLAEDGSKMSKSKRNYPDPSLVLEEYGADALRAYLINSPVVRAEPLLFNESGVRDVVRAVMLPLFHSRSFFVQYANIDNWSPSNKAPELKDRPEIDRWLLSKLQSLVQEVNEQMEGYYLYKVIPPMIEFIDDLTNWYIRQSRRRFWKNAADKKSAKDKESAYATLYEVLVTFSKVISPVLPFMSETLFQNLVNEMSDQKTEQSVHWCDFPAADKSKIDEKLEKSVAVIRQVVRMGRALREKYRIKTRQPLASVTVVTHDDITQEAVLAHANLLKQELNVKHIKVIKDDDDLCEIVIKPNFKTLGKLFGQQMKEAGQLISAFSRDEFFLLQQGKTIAVLGHEITLNDVTVTRQAKADVVIESFEHLSVALDTNINDELLAEGLMRETVSQLQKMRKDLGLEVTDRINLQWNTKSALLKAALVAHEDFIKEEVLATNIIEAVNTSAVLLHIDEHELAILMQKNS
ncbi:MAG: isoleucine--tRNA ligase [bacterium]|nr:isoleucine--tRNA ligase [bacterium]